ncbi:universal stress protein [Mastigocoleus sp. MO_188.B34]|uniref:universal stress protein n=1 Tax=Mastigocoleus sp. MO_188.B34 TaxID=3036635 RepID=UPI00263587EF|nr:universal stress protein [Mastigocoleus sp. MO_188.B34]MDJ0694218.1 universal stress protein [Mastigocoleus sp. MO_188.B34]
MFKTVLFPVDQSQEARNAAEVAIDVVKQYESRLILLSVVEEISSDSSEEENPMKSPTAVAKLLENVEEIFSKQGIEVQVIEKQGKPAFTICDVADEVNANLIVMGCRGLGLTEEGANDSVTNRVINLSPCPVLIVP